MLTFSTCSYANLWQGGRAKGRGGHGGKNFDDDSDFEDGPKKKSSKAIKAEPTFLPTRAIVPPLMTSAGGGMVSFFLFHKL